MLIGVFVFYITIVLQSIILVINSAIQFSWINVAKNVAFAGEPPNTSPTTPSSWERLLTIKDYYTDDANNCSNTIVKEHLITIIFTKCFQIMVSNILI